MNLKGFRTLLFAILFGIIGTLEAFNWTDLVPDAWEPFSIPIIAAAIVWLRKWTTTAMGKSE